MIANIVLGMLLVWFTCVLVITVRAGIDRRELDVRASAHNHQRRAVMDEGGAAPLLAPAEPVAVQPEPPEAVSASLIL